MEESTRGEHAYVEEKEARTVQNNNCLKRRASEGRRSVCLSATKCPILSLSQTRRHHATNVHHAARVQPEKGRKKRGYKAGRWKVVVVVGR